MSPTAPTSVEASSCSTTALLATKKKEERLFLKFRFEKDLTETELDHRKNSISNIWRAVNIEKDENLGTTGWMKLALAMDILDQWLLSSRSNRCAAVADSAILWLLYNLCWDDGQNADWEILRFDNVVNPDYEVCIFKLVD